MPAPFRIHRPQPVQRVTEGNGRKEAVQGYFERLHKLIPAEVVGMYLAGAGLIPEHRPLALVLWSVFCGIAVIIVRVWGTSEGSGPQVKAVVISFVSYVIWLYSMGGPFVAYPDAGVHEPVLGSLLVIAWTFIVPYFYKGDA